MPASSTTAAALVTGASRGIGRAIAERLAADGFHVLITYQSRAAEAEEAARAIISAGGQASAFRLEMGDAAAITDFFAGTVKKSFDLAVLVNNAGITSDGLLIRMKDEDFDRVLDVDLRAPFICSREAAKLMSKRRKGRIINISSVVGQMGNAGQSNYSAAKAGLIGLTKTCARELASRNITVNAVCPGFIETDMTAGLPDEVRQHYLDGIPLRRLGLPAEVGAAVAFLASDEAAYITGQVLAVNGGLYC